MAWISSLLVLILVTILDPVTSRHHYRERAASLFSTRQQQSCPFPSKLKTNYDFNWKSRANEWSNVNAKTDYLTLSLSWTPTFCASLSAVQREKEFQCKSNSFDLIVHGLWPQSKAATSIRAHPRNCRDDKQLNSTFVRKYYCMMPDEDLMQAEWEKHGTCYYKTPQEYYNTIEQLFYLLNIPDLKYLLQNKNVSWSTIRNAFLQLNPGMYSTGISIQMTPDNKLEEIKICYDLKLNFAKCKQ